MSEQKPINQAREERRDVESLTLLHLLSSLKPSQAWALVTILFAIVGGSFSLGFKFSSLSAQAEIARLKTENASLQNNIKEFRGVQTKERFLALYLRYLIAKDAYTVDRSEVSRETVNEAGDQLRSYIDELLMQGEEAAEDIDLRGLFLGKTPDEKVTVKFGYDGSVWPLPAEFGFAAASR